MILGIQKQQWLLLFLLLCVPLFLNAAAIWQDIGTDGIRQLLRGDYSSYPNTLLGDVDNPIPEIVLNILLFTAALGLLAWFMLFISNRVFFQKQPLAAKVGEALVMAWFVAAVFERITGSIMPLAWLPKFHDYLLGLPSSSFMVDWSHWLVFPTTAVVLFGAVFLSGNTKKG
jgi:hypothetical protein